MFKKIIHVLFILVFVALLAVGTIFYLDYRKHAPQREDYERLTTQDYTGVFFSTFPIDNYTAEDFEFYREIYPIKASYCIPDIETLNEYFLKVSESWNEVRSVYLGIRPDIITADDLLSLMGSYPDKYYDVILSYPSMEYWAELDEEEYPVVMQAYKDFVNTLMPLCEDNEWMRDYFTLYFYNSSEWLVSNPSHYESDFSVNAGISHMISMYTDRDHGYHLTVENYESALEEFEEIVEAYRAGPSEYPDLSKWDIVFFGDSVIAFEDTSSIPDALSGLTGAHTYNCARGGSSAARTTDSNSRGISETVDSFLAEDLSGIEEGSLEYNGMSDYFKNSKKKNQKCFVLGFGLNDFYFGHMVQSDAPNDVYPYRGARPTAVEKLQAAYPDALILLMTPNYTSYFGNGMEPQSDVGGLITDYVVAAMLLSEEMDTLLFDSYNELGIDSTNQDKYLVDGAHPNEATRFYIAQRLAEILGAQIPSLE